MPRFSDTYRLGSMKLGQRLLLFSASGDRFLGYQILLQAVDSVSSSCYKLYISNIGNVDSFNKYQFSLGTGYHG